MNLVVNYESGVKMSYSLNAFMPWEGYIVSFNGTKGRLEHTAQETVYISGDGTVPGRAEDGGHHASASSRTSAGLRARRVDGRRAATAAATACMLDDLFDPRAEPDKYLRAADQRGGAYSILTGIAANQSMATGQAGGR